MEMDSYFNGVRLKHKLKNYKYDILHYADPTVSPILKNERQIVTVHDNPGMVLQTDLYLGRSLVDIGKKNLWKRNINKYKEFENVLTNLNYVRKSLLEYGFNGNIETIYLPVAPYFKKLRNKNETRKELGLLADKIILLSVSTNGAKKKSCLNRKGDENTA